MSCFFLGAYIDLLSPFLDEIKKYIRPKFADIKPRSNFSFRQTIAKTACTNSLKNHIIVEIYILDRDPRYEIEILYSALLSL